MRTPAVEQLYVEAIEVKGSRRDLNENAVKSLAESIGKIGLRTPITIRSNNESMAILVAGAHRLAAVKLLGWEKVDCIVVDCDELDAELWEIAENLHRADLSKEQRDTQIRRYAELLVARDEKLQSRQNVAIESKRTDGRGHRQKGVAAKVAEETGVNIRTVQRVLAPPPVLKLAPEPITDEDAAEKQYARIVSAWNAAGAEARQRFREYIDTPIVDGDGLDIPAFLDRRRAPHA